MERFMETDGKDEKHENMKERLNERKKEWKKENYRDREGRG